MQVIQRNWQGQFLAPGPVYLDSSVTVAWLRVGDAHHARAVQFTGDHFTAGVAMQVSLLTLDETLYRLAKDLIARAQGVAAGKVNPGLRMKQNPTLLATLAPKFRLAIGYVRAWATLVDARTASADDVLASWLDRCGDIGGLHDAWHLSIAEHSGARSLVTTDADFQTVATLPVPFQIIKL
jgi:predicted nucleic acid-binding protein